MIAPRLSSASIGLATVLFSSVSCTVHHGVSAPIPDGRAREILQRALVVTQRRIECLSHNIANVYTPGYKRMDVDLSAMPGPSVGIGQEPDASGIPVPTSPTTGGGVRVVGTTTGFESGVLEHTGRALDVAIDGDGFFRVMLRNGQEAYQRGGRFHVNSAGRIVTSTGLILVPEILLPEDGVDVVIAPNGQVTCPTGDTPEATKVLGQIKLFRFVAKNGLLRGVDSVFLEHGTSGAPMEMSPGKGGAGVLRQYFLERSNVQLVNELQALGEASRYQQRLRSVLGRGEVGSASLSK